MTIPHAPLKRFRLVLAVGASVAIWSGCSPGANSETDVRRSLGGYPVCEASAAAVVSCPGSDKPCLLVGDNEVNDRLFLYDIDDEGNGVHLKDRREVYLTSLPSAAGGGALELSDIEAIAGLPPGEVILYGSHSRNKRCEPKGKRRIFAHGLLNANDLGEGSNKPVKSKKHSCKRLFGDAPDPVTQTVCEAIARGEENAEQAAGLQGRSEQEQTCEADPAFNLEGAVAVPEANGPPRVWIGLRAPLVDDRAVLLRQKKKRKAFAFDAVAFVDLGGRGIRELTFADGRIWGIGGPAADSDAPHVLWHVDASALDHGAQIEPTLAGELPNFAEGLAIWGQHAFVLMDGDQPADATPMTCSKNSEYIVRQIAE